MIISDTGGENDHVAPDFNGMEDSHPVPPDRTNLGRVMVHKKKKKRKESVILIQKINI